ncbi:hypothetical protein ALC62_00575, partial [Cyphomyrmex costatus]
RVVVICGCGRRNVNSGPLLHTSYEINRRIVFVMRILGIGMQGLNLFCNLMDLCEGFKESSYNNVVQHIYNASKSVFESCTKKAVEEEKKENEKRGLEILNFKISGDGSWKKLSNDDLLQRCLGVHTQNANESFNATIWHIAPKHLNSGLKITEIAAYLAEGIFTEGFSSILRVMQRLELTIGTHCMSFANKRDEIRVSQEEHRSHSASKEARKARIDRLLAQNALFEEAEGLLYGAGIADL